MARYKIFFLFIVILLTACKKEKAIEEPSEYTIPSNNFLIDITSQWTVREVWHTVAPYPFDDYYIIDTTIFYFDEDTSISRLTVFDSDSISNYSRMNNYYKLHYVKRLYKWCLTNEDPSNSPGTLITSFGTACFIRQDTLSKRVYVARNEESFFPMLSDDKEYVLYDFNLNVTDALPYNAWNGGLGNIYTVDTLEYMVIDGKNLKTFKVYEDNYLYRGTIIEGIGSLEGFIGSYGKLIHFQNSEIDFYP